MLFFYSSIRLKFCLIDLQFWKNRGFRFTSASPSHVVVPPFSVPRSPITEDHRELISPNSFLFSNVGRFRFCDFDITWIAVHRTTSSPSPTLRFPKTYNLQQQRFVSQIGHSLLFDNSLLDWGW